MTFDSKNWIRRFGAALGDVVDSAEGFHGVLFGVHSPNVMPTDDYRKELRRRYRELAVLANEHPYAAKLFDESYILLEDLPDGLQALLLEHPILAQAWSADSQDGFRLGNVTGPLHAGTEWFIARLAKLSARVGGDTPQRGCIDSW